MEGTRDEQREELLHKQRVELQHYNDMKEGGSLKPSRKALRLARRNTDKTDMDEEDSMHGKKRGPPEWVQSVGNKAMPMNRRISLRGKIKERGMKP